MALGVARLGFPLLSSPRDSNPFHIPNRRCVAVGLLRRPISASLVGKEKPPVDFTEPESRLIDAILGLQGRGRSATAKQLKDVESAVNTLEKLGGVCHPTSSDLVEGRWQLIFTTRPATASPIQRTFVGVDSFKVFQEIYLKRGESRVSNIIQFSEAIGELKVEAAASINDGKRILFRFDRAAFFFKFLPFKVPYPVPFRLLGDEAKGWIDTTYLSSTGNVRISKGNKGTTFVLQKTMEPRQKLLSVLSVGVGIPEAIEEFITLNHGRNKEFGQAIEGEWKLIWVSQREGERFPATATYGYKGLQIVKKNYQVENVVSLFPGLSIHARGRVTGSSDNDYNVTMSGGSIVLGSLKIPLTIKSEFKMKLLYADNKVRITQSDKQVIFVHLSVGEE